MKVSEFKAESLPQLFLDMDGVLCDLYDVVTTAYNVDNYKLISSSQMEKFFLDSDAEELFANLPPFKTNNELLTLIDNTFGSYTILSSPLQYDYASSIRGKKRWLKYHIPDMVNAPIFDSQKYMYAKQADGTPNILIDDYGKNIRLWNEYGGIGIKWQANEQDISELKSLIDEAIFEFCLD